MSPLMEFRILGPLEVAEAGQSIRLGSRRERAVLTALVLAGGDVVSADRLIDALWGDHPPRSAAKTLQNNVLKLRKALGPGVIDTCSPGYRLAGQPSLIDSWQFDRVVRSALDARAAGQPGDAATRFREALGLWRGAPLEELQGWAPADAEAARLSELRRVAAEELVDAEIACGRAASAVAELESMVAEEPLRERRWAMLMLALYRCGRQADALRTYQRARTLLGDELGIEPGPELRALEGAIAAQDGSLDLLPDAVVAGDDEGDPSATSPYKGLMPFEAEDRALFFGRTAVVADLLGRVGRDRFVVVVGASGSGKSSVIRAGLLASLRDGGLPGSEAWPTMVMTPGSHPLMELASGLALALKRPVSEVADQLQVDPCGLASLARDRVPSGAQLAIVVDQLEELFTQTRDAAERQWFVALLVGALNDVGGRVTVALAIRADFYGQCATHPELAALLDRSSTLLCPMAPDELREAVTGPAVTAGLEVEPGLVELVVHDIGEEPSALPLLSHALLETWKRRRRRALTVAGYREAGGASGAIALTAESLYRRFDPREQARARQLFLRLTELGDGTEDTSRRVSRDELVAHGDGTPPDAVLQQLAAARLVTIDADTVQVAHEAIIREWPRLQGWLDDDREGRRVHRHLTHAASDWEALGHEPGELYRGPRLAAASEWLAQAGNRDDLNALEAAFLQASSAREGAEQAAREEQASARERSNHRLRALLVAVGVALVLALATGATAVVQRNRANDEATSARAASLDATVGRLVAQSKTLQSENRYLGALLAVEANHFRDDPQTRGALLSALLDDPQRVLTIPTPTSDAVAPLSDGSALVLTQGRVERWDLAADKRLGTFPGPFATALTVAPSGTVAVGRADGSMVLVDPSGKARDVEIHAAADMGPGPGRTIGRVETGGFGLGPGDLAFSPDGRFLAAAFGIVGDPAPVKGEDSVRVWDTATGEELPARYGGNSGPVTAVAFSRDGRVLITGGDDAAIVLHDASTGAMLGAPRGMGGLVMSVSSDPSRNRIAVGALSQGEAVLDLDTHEITSLGSASEADGAWSADGARLVVGGDGVVQVYDAKTFHRIGAPIVAQTGLASPRFDSRGRILVGGRSGPATLWDLEGQSVLVRPLPGAPTYVFPMAGGRFIAAPDRKDSVTLYDARTLRPLLPVLSPGPGPSLHFPFPTAFAASYYDGDQIAVINRAGTMQRYDVASRRPIGAPFQLGFPAVYAVYSRDMRTIAVGGYQGEIALVDLGSHRVRRLESHLTTYVDGLAFTPLGDLVASAVGQAVVFRHLERRSPVVDDLSRFTHLAHFTQASSGPAGMDISPDGRTMAIGSGGSVAFVDLATEALIGAPVHVDANPISWIAFSRDGKTIVTSDPSNTARLLDVATRQVVGPILDLGPVTGPVFSSDSKTLGTSTPRGGALLSVDPVVWRREACRLAGRNLTDEEWARYLPDEGPRQRTCPQYH